MKFNEFITVGSQILKSIFDVKVLKRRIPLYCEWEVTNHCNMKCEFCSTWVKDRNMTEDLSTNEAVDIIKQLSQLGTRIIHFSGGEPTLRKDLPELISEAKRRGMIVSVTTNGSASLDAMENILHADLIRVSIDGTEEFHDSRRKTPGAFKKAVEILDFLKKRGVRPQVNTVYTPQTTTRMLEELVGICSRTGAQLSLNILSRNINDTSTDEIRNIVGNLSSPFFKEYIKVSRTLRKKYGPIFLSPEPFLTIVRKGGLGNFGCRAMDITISIKNDGSVSLPCNCLSIRCQKGSLRDIYYSKDSLQLKSAQGKYLVCEGCYIKCMCMASALLSVRGMATIACLYLFSIFKKRIS